LTRVSLRIINKNNKTTMENYKENDFIRTKQGHIDVIIYLDKPNFTIDGEEYGIDTASPIPIDYAKGIVLYIAVCCAPQKCNGAIKVEAPSINLWPTNELQDKMGISSNSRNDKDKTENYWLLSDISKAFLKENNIQYVHELQHYLEGKSLLRIKKHTIHSDM
jgi:hypothetical protein